MRHALIALVALTATAAADDLILLELSGGSTIAVRMADGEVTVLGVFQTVTVIEATPVDPPTPGKTRITYVFEKDQNPTPVGVAEALTELSKRGYMATEFEKDTVDGEGQVPDQYKAARQAALDNGLPALVVESSGGGLVVVDDPRTKEDVMKAVPKQEKTDATD